MTTPSNAAKALGVLTFTSNVETDAKAVEIYDALDDAADDVEISEVMDKFDVARWDGVDHLTTLDWWIEIETLAQNFDRLTKEMPA